MDESKQALAIVLDIYKLVDILVLDDEHLDASLSVIHILMIVFNHLRLLLVYAPVYSHNGDFRQVGLLILLDIVCFVVETITSIAITHFFAIEIENKIWTGHVRNALRELVFFGSWTFLLWYLPWLSSASYSPLNK